MTQGWPLTAVLAVQAVCGLFFLGNIVISVLGLTTISWFAHELIEIGAAIGLILGSILGAVALSKARRRTAYVEAQLQAASGAFSQILEQRFVDWGLTPAERDVALLSIKGMSISEIADLRNSRPGTVKAQTSAVYRKAGVSGRPQLLSQFIDELMSDSMLERDLNPPATLPNSNGHDRDPAAPSPPETEPLAPANNRIADS